MSKVCSLKPCEAWHNVVACNPAASVVVAGGHCGISLLERGVAGRRRLFPDQAVGALAFTTLGESFAFACHRRDVSLVEMCGYTIIYRLQVPQGIDIVFLEFIQNQLTEREFTSDDAESSHST